MNHQNWTGERLETFVQTKNTVEHLHRYAIACSICKNLDVLDIASGEGYGSNLLSMVANKVTGVDISKEAVELAVKKYIRGNLEFKEGSASKIPLPDNSFDLVVSFETIEHHDEHLEMLAEIKRVLKPDGVLLISSPDKKYYTDIPNYKNPFHVRELYFAEFKDLISKHFINAEFFGQKVVTGSLIIHENQPNGFVQFEGNYESVRGKNDFAHIYNLCVASDGVLPNLTTSLFDGEYINEIRLNDMIKIVKGSWSYRIGSFILSPLKLLKR